MATTPNRNLPLPQDGDLISLGDDAIRDLANKLDASASFAVGTLSARPATPAVGSFYWATDAGTLYVYAGTWVEVSVQSPIGTVTAYGGQAPSDPRFLVCDGAAYSRSTYSKLYANLGGANSPHGQGDGGSTFNVPDYRGRTLVGTGTGSGLTAKASGARGGTENETAPLPVHSHGLNDPGHDHAAAVVSWIITNNPNDPGRMPQTPNGTFGSNTNSQPVQRGFTGISVQDAGTGGTHNNMQPFAVATFIIRAL